MSCRLGSISVGRRPAITSSSRSSRGRSASALANSSRRASATDSSPGRPVADAGQADLVEHLVGGLERARHRAGAVRPIQDRRPRRSPARSEPRNGLTIWNVRATPAWAMVHGRAPVRSLPSISDPPRRGLEVPGDEVDQVLLPAPFGPITPSTCPSGTLNETSVDRLQAAEAPPQALRLQDRPLQDRRRRSQPVPADVGQQRVLPGAAGLAHVVDRTLRQQDHGQDDDARRG